MGDKTQFRSSFHKVRKIFRALLARAILLCHSIIVIYVTVTFLQDTRYYGLYGFSLPLFAVEVTLSILFRDGLEMKRFCTPFLCYLLTVVPALWVQELDARHNSKAVSNGSTDVVTLVTTTVGNVGNVTATEQNVIAAMFADINVTSLLEQSMMIVLLLCRWLLPRGRINRNSLSQLLVMYSAISADILDFCEIFREEKVRTTAAFQYAVLGVWSLSLIQFTLVVTTSSSPAAQHPGTSETRQRARETSSSDTTETVSILMVLFMQDGPFLIIRLYAVCMLGVSNYLIIFFSLKNALTVVLALYRVLVLCRCVETEGNDLLSMEEIARSRESLDTVVDGGKQEKQKRKKY